MGALLLLHDYTDVNKAHPPFHFPALKVSPDLMWLKNVRNVYSIKFTKVRTFSHKKRNFKFNDV